MKLRIGSRVAVFGALSALSPSTLWPQQPTTLTERSYAHARAVLDRGVQALGGLSAFQAVSDIFYRSHASVPEIGQSAAPDAPYFLRPVDGEGVIDLRGRRNYQIRDTHYLGSGARGSSLVTTDRSGFTSDLRSGAVYSLDPSSVAFTNRGALRTFPYMLLQLALNRAGTLRWLGESELNGQRLESIAFTDSEGGLTTLCFDAETGVLAKTEGLTDNFLAGLTTSETLFSDYRSVDGVRMPFHVVSKLGSALTSDLTYSEIKFNTRPQSDLFEMPKNATTGPEIGGPPKPITLTVLARDVYYVDAIATNSIFFYSAMFVVFNDYVLVVEAPLSDGVSQAIIAKINETAPGKPIRYLVPTHYHTDHTGGVRGYIAEGTTIVTTPGNRRFFENVASVTHPLAADRLSLHPRAVSIETFVSKRVFSDGDHRVELFDLGPTPHVDEMVIAYVPAAKLAFVSDLVAVSYMGRLGPVEPGNALLYEKTRQLGLDIETIAGGHGRIATMSELQQVLAGERPPPAS